jgi:flagellar biosynthesis/type III secretory pathway protein FliH
MRNGENGPTVQLPLRIGKVGVLGAAPEEEVVEDLRDQMDPYFYGQVRKLLLREIAEEMQKECLAQIREELEAELEARRRETERQLAARRQDVEQAAQAIEQAAAELTRLRDGLLAEARASLPSLVAKLTGRILGRAIDAGDYEIDAIVREALKELPPRGQIIVRMNPDDYAKSQLAGQGAGQSASSAVQFVRDQNISRGGCVVESNEGRVDATIEESLNEIERTVRDSMETM